MNGALELFASRFAHPYLAAGGEVCISSLTGAADAFLALSLALRPGPPRPDSPAQPTPVLVVTPGLPDADRIADDLRELLKCLGADPKTTSFPTRILEFPPILDGDRTAIGTRLKTIAALRAWGLSPYPVVVVSPFSALSSPIPAGTVPAIQLGTKPEEIGKAPIKYSDLCKKLADSGYNRVP